VVVDGAVRTRIAMRPATITKPPTSARGQDHGQAELEAWGVVEQEDAAQDERTEHAPGGCQTDPGREHLGDEQCRGEQRGTRCRPR
jgi:hypothetical protein